MLPPEIEADSMQVWSDGSWLTYSLHSLIWHLQGLRPQRQTETMDKMKDR